MSRNERRPLLQGGGPFSWAGEVLDASDPIMTGTVGGTAINLSACALGASMLSLPYTMSIAGPGIALDFLLLFAIMAYFAAQAVIRAGLAAKKSTYAEIVRTYFGPVCGFIVNILLSLALIVAAISYIVGLADLLPDMIPWAGALSRSMLILITVLVLYPFTLVGTLAAFGPASALACGGCYLLALSLVVGLFTSSPGEWTAPPLLVWTTVNPSGVIFSLPMICFVYAFHYVLTDSISELEDPTRKRVSNVNLTTVSILFCCYLPVSVAGYLLKSGTNISSNILAGMSSDSVTAVIANWSIGALLLITYSLFIIPLRRKIENITTGRLSSSVVAPSRLLTAAVLNAFICIVSIMLPDLGFANTLAGGCIALIMFFFPGCLMVRLQYSREGRDRSIIQIIFGIIFILFGAVICFVGLFGSLFFDY